MQPDKNLIVDREIKDSFLVARLNETGFTSPVAVSVTYNRIFLLSAAKGTIEIDGHTHSMIGQEVFLVAKGQVFSFSNDTMLSGFEILFGDCFWEKAPNSAANCKTTLFNNASLHQRLPLSSTDSTAIIPVCELLLLEYSQPDYPNKLDAMAAYLKIIMIKLANILTGANSETNNFDNHLYHQFLHLISDHYQETREVADYAAMLSVSTRKLSEVCKQKSGHGAKEIINSYLIAAAKKVLQFSSKPIKEIAFELSFTSPEQFSHFFKKNTNTSPADYRDLFVNIGR